ncbi:HepT-like ribonuclease domain-containing protein [Nitrosophilus kaiyonis]|uniref:HepT-like ribonuclease domain-containing protein n=1 Tax=Nitrosophilus kaiyonis TaxID=2930200 RepID=UPI0024937A24|nr:HepT-like ribonuclease domain-containing protein [Nitrosophilus kaiyonis]
MSKRVAEFFLFDIFIAILKIENSSKKFSTAQEILYDYQAWDTIIREFEIIGEATKKLINYKILNEEKRVIVDFRNLLIHNYFGIDPEEVWDIIKNDLPQYKKEIVNLIKSIDKNLKNELIESFIEYYKYLDFVINELEKLK